MRIISKFHDYYDSVLAYGHDKSIFFNRKQSEERIKLGGFRGPFSLFEKELPVINTSYGVESKPFIIGFCGKLYFGIILKYSNYNYTFKKEDVCYSPEEIYDFFASILDEKDMLLFSDKQKRYVTNFYKYNNLFLKNTSENLTNKYGRYFIDNSIAIFSVKRASDSIEVLNNPCLSDYKFYKIFDSYTAYQEISMYISGVLGSESKELIEIDDISIRDAKGFDSYSFKTKKGYKPNRKRK